MMKHKWEFVVVKNCLEKWRQATVVDDQNHGCIVSETSE